LKTQRYSITTAICLFAAFTLVACESTSSRTGPPAEVVDRQVGKPGVTEPETRVHAAPLEGYILPDSSSSTALENATALIAQGEYGQAQDQLADLDPETMTPDMTTRKRTLDAMLLLQADGTRQAAQLLQAPPESVQPATLATFYQVRAEVELRLGHTVSALDALVRRDTFLNTSPAVDYPAEGDHTLLWGTLSMIRTGELMRLAQGREPILSSWARLALAVREQHGNPTGTDQAIRAWRAVYPNHPASTALLDKIKLDATTQDTRPASIALLLPVSSHYAQAAGAIRDGITSMNNDLPTAQRNDIRVYDYGEDQNLVGLYYRQAVNNGANIVIGPLGRTATNQLLASADITTTTILLTPADDRFAGSEMLYTFALSPEQEARQAASRTWLDGHRTSVMLYPRDALGQRMAEAYREHYSRLGGRIIGQADYGAASEGFSVQIKKLLGVDQSEQRINELSRLLGTKLKHEARRRQDIGAIFLPATTDDARLIKPEFDFYYALDLPVYSTSRVFDGRLDTINDVDLERVRFPDMPWMIANNIQIESLRTFLQPEWAREGNRYERLYALGMDLHRLIPQLATLALSPQLYQQGLTGNLHISRDGDIEHDLVWAVFRKGIPRLLDRNSGYQGRYDEHTLTPPPATPPATRQAR
jgi:hypothetical protein